MPHTRPPQTDPLLPLCARNRAAKDCAVHHSQLSDAVFLADRVLVMSPRPGRIVGEIVVDLLRPRTVATTELPAFVNFTREVRRHLNSASVIE